MIATHDDIRQTICRLDEIRLGDFGERIVAGICRSSGVGYIPLSRIERDHGGSPRVEQKNGFIALPDIDAAADEWTAFIEVKCKTQAVLFRKKNQVRHGIDRIRFHDCQRAAERFKKHCAVAIVELHDADMRWSGSFLIERLVELDEPYSGEGSERHMVYWARKRFRDLHSFTPQELWDIANNLKPAPSFADELRQIFARKKQRGLFDD